MSLDAKEPLKRKISREAYRSHLPPEKRLLKI